MLGHALHHIALESAVFSKQLVVSDNGSTEDFSTVALYSDNADTSV